MHFNIAIPYPLTPPVTHSKSNNGKYIAISTSPIIIPGITISKGSKIEIQGFGGLFELGIIVTSAGSRAGRSRLLSYGEIPVLTSIRISCD